jgi:hypothetical protein
VTSQLLFTFNIILFCSQYFGENFHMSNSYKVAVKAIHSINDFEAFQKSSTCKQILDFVKDCAESVVGSSMADEFPVSEAVTKFVVFMDVLHSLVDEIPPLKQPMRFGNKAFRIWHEKVAVELSTFLVDLLPAEIGDAAIELTPYFLDMFGNTTRIDYGTGHELNFALVFLILLRLGVIVKSDLKAVVLRGFSAYIRTMRRLQKDYMLEPAGSHGVWGLDDYHCLVFLWGAAQLVTLPVKKSLDTVPPPSSDQDVTTAPHHPQHSKHHEPLECAHDITPSSVLDIAVLRQYAGEYLYLEGILFIRTIKSSAPFAETSPMLHDISGMHDWAKVCSGLMKLFQGEVLFKFPVAQHILFGSVISATWQTAAAATVAGPHGEESATSRK